MPTPMRKCVLPLLKISVEPDGRVRLPNHALDTDTEWWSSVLGDHRARTHFDNDWEDKIGRHPGQMLHAKCECGFSMGADLDPLIKEWGVNISCLSIAAMLRDDHGHGRCKRRDCKLTYETTVPFKPPSR